MIGLYSTLTSKSTNGKTRPWRLALIVAFSLTVQSVFTSGSLLLGWVELLGASLLLLGWVELLGIGVWLLLGVCELGCALLGAWELGWTLLGATEEPGSEDCGFEAVWLLEGAITDELASPSLDGCAFEEPPASTELGCTELLALLGLTLGSLLEPPQPTNAANAIAVVTIKNVSLFFFITNAS